MKVLVFFPTYIEAGNVEALVRDIRQELPEADVLAVDDASPDGTGRILDRLAAAWPGLTVVHRPGKMGLGSAHKLAMAYARNRGVDVLITMDADYSHHPRYLRRFVELLEEADFVTGSRYALGGRCNYGWGRLALSRGANALARAALGLHLRENTTAFRGFRGTLLRRMRLEELEAEGYSFLVESLHHVSGLSDRLVEFPIVFDDRTEGASKISRHEVWNAALLVGGLIARRPPGRAVLAVAGALLFIVLATANGAGYRYGASDQAFYVPAILEAAAPQTFSRDDALLDAQARLMVLDEVLGAVVRSTGVSIERVSLAGYLASLAIMWSAALLIGGRLYGTPLATAALAAALTLRHQIPGTSANSFEPYFHPRMLAFGVGMLAVAALLRRRALPAVALVAASAVLHATTGVWFAVMVGVALCVLEPRCRRLAALAALPAAALGAWLLTAGPLAGRLVVMDERWLLAVASKDTLFATAWPAWAWAANFALLGVAWWALRARAWLGGDRAPATALVWGATALVGIFLATLPLVASNVAFFVQLQVSRVFWLVDFVATVLLVGVLAGVGPGKGGGRASLAMPRRAVAVAGLFLAFAAGRGAYIMLVERPERALFAVGVADSRWEDAMRWLDRQPDGQHVLADPGHAWKHGVSIRVDPAHDVYLEEVKDAALAIYSEEIAARVVERTTALGDFAALTADRAVELAMAYDLHYLVTEADLPLPLRYRNQQFSIYALSPAAYPVSGHPRLRNNSLPPDAARD